MRTFLLLLVLVVPAWAGSDDYYECTDAAGVVTESVDRCSHGQKERRIGGEAVGATVDLRSYSGPVRLGVARVSVQGLVMYSAAGCGYCELAKRYMARKGIAFREVDIGRSQAGADEYRRQGGNGGVPFFVFGRRTMFGFNEAKLNSFLGL